MRDLTKLLEILQRLKSLSQVYCEESARVRITGDNLNKSIRHCFSAFYELCRELQIPEPNIRCAEDYFHEEDFDDDHLDGEKWVLFFSKAALVSDVSYRENESKYIFLSLGSFNELMSDYDPFRFDTPSSLRLGRKTTIIIVGLTTAFGNNEVWYVPYGQEEILDFSIADFPNSGDISSLIRTNSSDGIRVSPELFCLTWGNYQSDDILPLIRKLSEVMVACLAQEIKKESGHYFVTIRGAKKVTLKLCSQNALVSTNCFDNIMNTIRWIYSERAETRLQLITDRLSIDASLDKCFLTNVCENIDFALQQARDSYAFVILDRKDSYYKELREIMKDMKSQADLYAAKVRDLIGSLARDALGVLLFVSMSFIGKFDRKQIHELLSSNEAGLMLKCISIYLAITCFVTLFIHWRDATLSYKESRTWLTVLQQYSSSEDRVQRFIEPLTSRLITLLIVGAFTAIVYTVLSIIVWNLQFVVELLLSQ
ncbi:hypothetical protein ACET99_01105 [Aeromonas caviae]|uniref:hypothetical protein n=1 Tax=Aeromonas TaxID=642 RepID=UPI0022E80963|nr:hypothetical protein [Aeromonas sp. QDB17]